MKIANLIIVGVGLIGGSIGLAAKKRGLAGRVLGIGRTAATLEKARQLGAIDECFAEPASAMRCAEVAVFCTPVNRIAGQVLEYAAFCPRGALLTDAGSTKGQIVADVEGKLPDHVDFIGSHPLAGSEKRGPDHADPDLFQNRVTVLTPTPRTRPAALERTRAFWEALGSRVLIKSPGDHDRALAITSHLPHLAAAALAGTLDRGLFDLAATGYRDTTRIAAGDPELWTAIFAQNRTAVLEALAVFRNQLDLFRDCLTNTDWKKMDTLLAEAKKVRDALGS
jgi:prephenate dehydrogenase